jgi:hypothetical protein
MSIYKESEKKTDDSVIPEKVKPSPEIVLFIKNLIMHLIKLTFFVIFSSTFMYTLHETAPSFTNKFPTSPYDINPPDYLSSMFGVTRGFGGRDILTQFMTIIMRFFRYIGYLIQAFLGIDTSSITEVVDVRFDNPFTLANVYSWAQTNSLFRWAIRTLRDIGFTNNPRLGRSPDEISLSQSPAMMSIAYNILYYFSTSIFTLSAPVFGAASVFGMIVGLTKFPQTKIPPYGPILLLGLIALTVVSLIAFPVSVGLYVIMAQMAFYFYYLFFRDFFLSLFKPGKFSEKFGFLFKYAWKAKWAILAYIVYAVLLSGKASLSKKQNANLMKGTVGVCSTIVVVTAIIKFVQWAMKKRPPSSPSPSPSAQ